jgi:Protein of unknown function (DUF3108)
MNDIARKPTGAARLQHKFECGAGGSKPRRGAIACVAIAALALSVAAIFTPGAGHAGPDSTADAGAPRPHTRRHRGPTPTPTPMALPPEVKAKVPVYKAGTVPFHDGEVLTYQATWLGIPAAGAKVRFHKKVKEPSPQDPARQDPAHTDRTQRDPAQTDAANKDPARDGSPLGDPSRSRESQSRWIAEVWVKTTPYADVFYKMRDYMRENIAEDTLHTGGVHVDQHENSRLDSYEVAIDRPDQMVTVTKTSKHGVQVKQFIASDPWGPLSGAMMALTQDLTPGKTYAFDVFSGSQRYVFSFDVQERERIHTVLGDFDALRIVPDVWYVSDGKLRSQAHGTMLWVTADKRHLPLRIQSEAFIGSVRAELIKIENDGSPGKS